MTHDNNNSLPFRESVELLLQLHDVMTKGNPDGEEADAIRDAMDVPWYAMSHSKQALVRGLSADLYTIGASESSAKESSLPTGELEGLVRDNKWSEVLDLVRLNQATLSSHEAAFTRAVAWMHLGQPEVALRFFRELERLRALSDAERIWLLTCLMQTGRTGETIEVATQFVESQNPLVRLRAANSLSLAAQQLTGGEAHEVRDRAIEITEEALPKVEPLVDEDHTAKLIWRSSLFQLTLDYEEVGQSSKAAAACQRILEREPTNFDAQILMDWLIYEQDPDAARQRFRGHFRTRLPQQTRELPSLVTDSAA
jgi:tetratricopeptide (TPR) repeat protein